MTRVLMGPPASRWWIAYLLVFGACLVEALVTRRWGTAALVAAVLAVGLVTTAGSLRLQLVVHALACGLAAVSAVIALLEERPFWVAFGVVATLVLGALVPLALREGSGGRIRTEELVGRSVSEAERLLGYPSDRQPGGLGTPVLVAVPFARLPDGAERRTRLVVTAVAVDPAGPWIAFGVAPAAYAPALDGRARRVLQAELHARVGGFPAALRSERPAVLRSEDIGDRASVRPWAAGAAPLTSPTPR